MTNAYLDTHSWSNVYVTLYGVWLAEPPVLMLLWQQSASARSKAEWPTGEDEAKQEQL